MNYTEEHLKYFEINVIPKIDQKPNSCWAIKNNYTDSAGYYVRVVQGKQIGLHRLSYRYYKGLIPEGLLVRHTCDNPACINPEHLLIGTHKDNSNDKVDRDRQAKGITHEMVKLTEQDVKTIYTCTIPLYELAAIYNVTKADLAYICRGEIWKHITKDLVKGNKYNPTRILTDKQALEIIESSDSVKDLSEFYGVSLAAIYKIKDGTNFSKLNTTINRDGIKVNSKLTEEEVIQIYLSLEDSETLAIRYNLTTRSINQIRSGETRRDITTKLVRVGTIKNNSTKLTNNQVIEILKALENRCKTLKQIGAEYGVTKVVIQNIRDNKTKAYKEVIDSYFSNLNRK